ncbi:PaaI family thioesterase [Pusillimonas caeni]|uniref:PaaI family thioesterase n=1 Tax=Pusillimonas caeni TaxID=1348472 RepID=UPI000E59C6A8|nr:PaaI family thioesterase [Pusillimonas caeni]TFL15027.1 PaaI family thioesterase [Pusillimonas caeni]
MSAPMTATEIQSWLDSSPFIRFLGLQCVEADAQAGALALSMPLRKELERGAGGPQFHGGAVASLIDTAGTFALIMGARAPVPTINFRVDYLRPSSGLLTARAVVRRAGKTVGVVDVDVYDEEQRLTAVGRGCFGAPAAA